MKMKKITGFTCFIAFLFSLIFILLFRLMAGMQEEKKQYTILLSLGSLTYDEDFLKTASKIKGLQKIYPVVEIPVTIKIDDYTKNTVFSAVDLERFHPGAKANRFWKYSSFTSWKKCSSKYERFKWSCHFPKTAKKIFIAWKRPYDFLLH